MPPVPRRRWISYRPTRSRATSRKILPRAGRSGARSRLHTPRQPARPVELERFLRLALSGVRSTGPAVEPDDVHATGLVAERRRQAVGGDRDRCDAVIERQAVPDRALHQVETRTVSPMTE